MTKKQANLVQNLGKYGSLKETMIRSGYAKSTAKSQSGIIDRDMIQKLLARRDKKAIKRHDEAFDATRETLTSDGSYSTPDYQVRLKAVELHYKARGFLHEANVHVGDSITINVASFGDSDHFNSLQEIPTTEPDHS